MKLILILALFFTDPETGTLNAKIENMTNPLECINKARDINEELASKNVANAYAVCTIEMKGQSV